jgi:phage-related protein
MRPERLAALKLCLNEHSLPQRFENMAKPPVEDRPKPVRWVGGSKEDLSGFPEEVRRRVGGALWEAQIGRKAPYAKPLKGFGHAGVLEIVDDFDGDTYRAVYTVRFVKAIYVLHAFQKKSKRGVATPRAELDLIDHRLKRAREDYEQWSRSAKPKSP